MVLVEPLEWDTEFFGVPIGRIHVEDADAAAVQDAEDAARADGLRCLYASIDPADRHATVRLQALGYRFVEAATTLLCRTGEPRIPAVDGVTLRTGSPDDLDELQPMVDLLADWSRFAVDPRFGREAARLMQTAWVRRAAEVDDGVRTLEVAESAGEIVAFITCRWDDVPTVDTVGTNARGSGAARYLMQTARDRAAPDGLIGGPIAARNVNALRYVNHCGYRPHEVRYLYHRWLDEETGTQ